MSGGYWSVDRPHSSVGFWLRYMVVARVSGTFEDWDCQLFFDPEDFASSSVEVHVRTASMDTHNTDRDEHVRSAGFLDSATYPEMVFKSTSVEIVDLGRFLLLGDLTLHGVTRPLELGVVYAGLMTAPSSDDRVGFEAKSSLDHRDFDMKWDTVLDDRGILVDNRIEIRLAIAATRAFG
jgi:polyisoprenoid-binding protein YceI